VLGPLPPDQCLGAVGTPGARVELRLVVQYELFALDRQPQRLLGLHLENQGLAIGLFEDPEAIAAVGLGPIEGDLGVADQRCGIGGP